MWFKKIPTSKIRTAQLAGNIEGEVENRDRKVKHIGKICDEAEEIRDAISDLWALDQSCWQRMLDLQVQLVIELHELAPGLSNNLRMMFYRLNNNHRICHILVTSRTRILVFNEFFRRVREFLDDYQQQHGKFPQP